MSMLSGEGDALAGHGALVKALHDARRTGRTIECPDSPKLSRSDGLKVQLEVLERFVRQDDALGGWKVAFTSGKSRDAMGPGYRPFGYILKSRIFSSGADLPLSIQSCGVEPELGVILGRPLRGPNVDAAAARLAVRAITPAFEINEIRFPLGSPPGLILADGIGNWGVVMGEPQPVRDHLEKMTVNLWVNEELVETSQPAFTMDDPFESLARVCRELDIYGLGLEPEQLVITGSFLNKKVMDPMKIRAEFKGVGDVRVNFGMP